MKLGKILASVLFAFPLCTSNAYAAPVDLAHGGSLTITSGSFNSKVASAFVVGQVISNSLLLADPSTSNVTAPATGNYIASTTVRTCTSGSRGYINSFVLLNGNQLANSFNEANECGSAVATVSFYAIKGDIISGMCSINQGVVSQCSFSLSLSGPPY